MHCAFIAPLSCLGKALSAKAAGLTDDQLTAAHNLQRKAQWRLDFIAAEHSLCFHADQKAGCRLGEATDYARQDQIELTKQHAGITCTACHEPRQIAIRALE